MEGTRCRTVRETDLFHDVYPFEIFVYFICWHLRIHKALTVYVNSCYGIGLIVF